MARLWLRHQYRRESDMTPELWQRLKPLFHAALEEDVQDRAAFIGAACGDDDERKTQLKQLLNAERHDTGSLDARVAPLDGFRDDKVPACKQRSLRLAGMGSAQ